MVDLAQQLEIQALQLPPKARALLARRLLASLDQAVDPDSEQLWLEESEQRLDELESGRATRISADRVFGGSDHTQRSSIGISSPGKSAGRKT